MSKTTIIAKMRPDGRLVRVRPDGTERVMRIPLPTPMTQAEVEAAAAADPDARPFTAAEMATARRVARTKTLRRALGLTQEEFAVRYKIPLGTLRDWEQGRSEPDQPARAYLTAIAGDPEGVRRAFGGQGLSGDVDQELAEAVDYAQKLLNVAIDVGRVAKVQLNQNWARDPKIVGLTLLCRSISNFRAAILLAQQQQVLEARSMVRQLYENFFGWVRCASAGLILCRTCGAMKRSTGGRSLS